MRLALCGPALSVLALLAPVAAQERARVTGVVRGLDGQAWPNATVVFSSKARFGWIGFEKDERLEIRANARGRFVAEIDRTRRYAIWALGGGEGGTRCTDYVLTSPVHSSYQLVESEQQPMPLRVRVYGLDAWKRHGPVRLRWIEACGNGVARELDLDAKNEFDLPIGPGAARIRIDAAHGYGASMWIERRRRLRELWLTRIAPERERWQRARAGISALPNPLADGLPTLEHDALLLPRPLVFRYRCLESGSRAPIPGTAVEIANPDDLSEHARFEGDANGEIDVVLPIRDELGGFAPDWEDYEAVLLARDHEPRLLRWFGKELHGELASGDLDLNEGTRHRQIEFLATAPPIEIRLQGRDQVSFDRVAVRHSFSCRTLPVNVVKERLAVLDPKPGEAFRLPCPVGKGHQVLAVTGLRRRSEQSPAALIPLHYGQSLRSLNIDLRVKGPLEVEILTPDGRPAPRAVARYLHGDHKGRWGSPLGRHWLWDTIHHPWVATSSRGVVRFHRISHPLWIWARTRDAFGALRVTGVEDDSKATLQLRRIQELRGRVLDVNGKRVGGATVKFLDMSSTGFGRAVYRQAMADSKRLGPVKTDDQGRFVLHVLCPRRGELRIHVSDRGGRRAQVFTVQPADRDEHDLELDFASGSR